MGKIRVKTIGEEGQEKQEKKHKIEKKKKIHISGMKGGERVVAVGPTEEELAQLPQKKEETTEPLKKKVARGKAKITRVRSKRYQKAFALVDRNKMYDLAAALELLEKVKGNRDETVELHINTQAPGISETVALPHGTHKKTRVAIASDSLIAEIEKGKVDFDVLLAHPSIMPKLVKFAKILGPRGLMPNPKAGTISNDPEALAKKFEGGQLRIRTEAKFPIIHASVGKVSFGAKKLSDNIDAVLGAVKKENIKKAVLKSTMSPGIKIQIT